MSKIKRAYLLVMTAGILLLSGCSSPRNVVESKGNVKVSLPRFFAPNFNKVLYKADMTIYGRELTGLMLFKKSKGVVKVAFISEIGLKYFNLEIPASDTAAIRFHYLIDMMNRKPVINMLETSFRMLFLHYPENDKNYRFECHDGWMVNILKDQKEKVNYSYQQNSGWVESARQYGWLKPRIRIEASDYAVQYPSKIQIRLKKKMKIDLEVIEE